MEIFLFVDCSKNDSIEKLEDMEIAELLFFGTYEISFEIVRFLTL